MGWDGMGWDGMGWDRMGWDDNKKDEKFHPRVVWFRFITSLQIWKQMFGLEIFIFSPLLAAATNTTTTTTATP